MFLGSLIDVVPLLKVEGEVSYINEKKSDAIDYSCNALRLHVRSRWQGQIQNVYSNKGLLIGRINYYVCTGAESGNVNNARNNHGGVDAGGPA